MKIVASQNVQEVARLAADLVVEVVRSKAEPVLILPAGATPLPLFMELVSRCRDGLDLSAAHVFQLDEIVGIGPTHAESFHRLLRDHLLDPLGHPGDRTHLVDGTALRPAAEIARHAADLEARGGADLAVLGLGVNGHVAYNEPGSTLEDGARMLELNATTRRLMHDQFPGDEVPTHGMTLGLREIAASKRLCILVTGASKADVLHRMMTEPPASDLPASQLLAHPDLTILADAPAHARLQPAS